MKRVLLLSLILGLLCCFPAMAVEDGTELDTDGAAETGVDPVTVETITKDEEGVTVNVTISQPETAAPADVLEGEETVSEDPVSIRTFSITEPDVLETAQSGDFPSVMADVVVQVLGEYHPKTQTVQEVDAEGNVIATSTEYVPGLAGLDYPWIAGAVLFALFLSGIFKLLGGLMRS